MSDLFLVEKNQCVCKGNFNYLIFYLNLQEGGEFYFSDIYVDRELDDKVRKDEILWGTCLIIFFSIIKSLK